MKNKFIKSFLKIGLLILALFLTFTGCKKEDDLQADEVNLRNKYLTENNITVAPTASGLYYIETLEGTGVAPTTGKYVTVAFTGYFLSGEEFGSDTVDLQFDADQILTCIYEALSYMNTGGKATIIVPSELAYGAAGYGDIIPAYTTLVYDIELIEVFDKQEREIELRNQYILDNEITTQPTASGLYYIETLEGTGAIPTDGQTVQVKYEGRLLSGEIFDSGTFSFELGAGTVIAGFDEGISYMKESGKATLILPSDLAYGSQGSGSIQPYTTLIFNVELIRIL